jgi:hypothetical protein
MNKKRYPTIQIMESYFSIDSLKYRILRLNSMSIDTTEKINHNMCILKALNEKLGESYYEWRKTEKGKIKHKNYLTEITIEFIDKIKLETVNIPERSDNLLCKLYECLGSEYYEILKCE